MAAAAVGTVRALPSALHPTAGSSPAASLPCVTDTDLLVAEAANEGGD